MFQQFMEPGIPPVVFWPMVALAVIIQGVSKSGFAGGASILSLPFMMLVMPADKVAAVFLPLLCLMDLNAIYHHRHNKVWSKVFEIYIPALGGIALGSLIWWRMGNRGVEHYSVPLKRFVGAIAIAFGLYILARERALAWVERWRPGRRSAIGFGFAAGFVSTLTHGAGPIVTLYMFSQGLGKSLFVGTVAWIFTFINLTKVPVYWAAGLFPLDVFLFDLTLVWMIPFGSWLGYRMHLGVDERAFNRIICILVLIAGIQLLADVNLIQLGIGALTGAEIHR